MKKSATRIGIKQRLLLLAFLSLVGVACVFSLAIFHIEKSLFEARYEQVRRAVDLASVMLNGVATHELSEGHDEEEMKKELLLYLRGVAGENQEYFFVLNMSGQFLLHPLPELHNTNAINLTDAHGEKIVQEIIKIVKNRGDGLLSYFWPPTGQAYQKTSYVMAYPQWGWIIGSGVYVDDIHHYIYQVEKKFALATLFFALIVFGVAYWIGRSVCNPILSLNQSMRRLAEGDCSVEVKELGRRDEIGSMAQTVQIFLENTRRMAVLEGEQRDTDNLKGEFVSVVSHELRTPLTSIRGSLGLVAAGAAGALPDKAKHLVSIAYNNCERLILLINDILDIDKIAAGNMQFDMKRENLQKLIAQSVEANKAYAEKYFVRYEIKEIDPSLYITVDSTRFQQVLANFLSNAAKFSLGGAHVDVAITVLPGKVRLYVQDYGLGMPDEFRSRIFKKFSQADTSSTRKKGGTGLGLYISKQLIEQMGGAIGYESKVGLGSIFWFEFPLDSSPPLSAPAVGPLLPAIGSLTPCNGPLPLLLHVEPDNSFSQYLAAVFHPRASVLNYETMKSAQDFLEHLEPCSAGIAVIADLNVKDVEGAIDLATAATKRNIPFIILSTREPPTNIRALAAAVMTKSKVSDSFLIQTTLALINKSLDKKTGEATR